MFACLRAVKSSPIKVVKITNTITGLKVSDALRVLKFCNLKLATTIHAVIVSALANAENNHNADIDKLYIKKIDVGRAFALKRFATRGRGKSSRILKTFSRINVLLHEKQLKAQTTTKSKRNGTKS